MNSSDNLFLGMTVLYGSILSFNIILSAILWMNTNARHYRIHAIACTWLLITGLIQGVLTKSPYIYQALACSLTFFSNLMFTKLLTMVVKFPYFPRKYFLVYVGGIVTTLLLHFLGVGPAFMILPILIGAGFPMFDMGLRVLLSKKKHVSVLSRCFALAAFLGALHNLDFAYAYTHPDWLFLGFTLALVFILSITTFSTASVLETLATENTQIRVQAEYGAMIANSARLASLGQMAGGMAHEINNPLAIIQMHAHQLKRVLKDEEFPAESAVKSAVVIEDTVFRINKIITGLRSFGRDAGTDPIVETSMKDIVNSTLQFTTEQFAARGIEIKRNTFPDSKVLCRPVQISQVIFNLLNNSFDAIKDSQSHKWIKIEMIEELGHVKLIISDNGSGIEENIREKIFHPFFTTKEIGGGAGLGLSSSLGIVEANQGDLYLAHDSEYTAFILTLPKS